MVEKTQHALRSNGKQSNGVCVTNLAIGARWKRSGRVG